MKRMFITKAQLAFSLMNYLNELTEIFLVYGSFISTTEFLLKNNRFELIEMIFKLPYYRIEGVLTILKNHIKHDINNSIMIIIDFSIIQRKHHIVINLLLGLGYELWILFKQYDLLHLFRRKRQQRIDPHKKEIEVLFSIYGSKVIREISLYSKSSYEEIVELLEG